jgi:hypothetical protein
VEDVVGTGDWTLVRKVENGIRDRLSADIVVLAYMKFESFKEIIYIFNFYTQHALVEIIYENNKSLSSSQESSDHLN